MAEWSSLSEAILEQNLQLFQQLIQSEDIDINLDEETGEIPLILVTVSGQLDMAKLLLLHKDIRVNEVDMFGCSAFFCCCAEAQNEAVKLLQKDSRLDVNLGQNEGATPFYVACQEGNFDIVRQLLRNPDVDVNKSMKKGESPLFVACQCGRLDIIKWMFASDRDIDLNQASNKQLALDYAIQNQYEKDVLLYQKATSDFVSPIDAARIMEFDQIIELIEAFEANPTLMREKLRKDMYYYG